MKKIILLTLSLALLFCLSLSLTGCAGEEASETTAPATTTAAAKTSAPAKTSAAAEKTSAAPKTSAPAATGETVFSEDFSSNADKWDTPDGTWAVKDGAYSVEKGQGPKAIAKDVKVKNFTFEVDITITEGDGNGGIVFRLSEPGVGADAYKGYYAGISPSNSKAEIGRANNDWKELATGSIEVELGQKVTLKVVVSGNDIELFVDGESVAECDISDVDDGEEDPIIFDGEGSIGLRVYDVAATYDNVKITE